jgi:hypothetical protein
MRPLSPFDLARVGAQRKRGSVYASVMIPKFFDKCTIWNMLIGMQTDESSATKYAFARFLRTMSTAALELAQRLEAEGLPAQARLSIADANLGSLQRQVAEAPGMDSEDGVSPRQIAQHLDRGDEPNIRTALAAMQKRGVAELVPGKTPQYWRLTALYRRSA